MTDLNKYVQDAIRTESRIEKVTTNPDLLIQALRIFIASGNILDLIKKNVFYGKPIPSEVISDYHDEIYAAVMTVVEHREEDINIDPRVFHALVGIATESTELMEALSKAIKSNEIDFINILEEFGDINWYQAIGIDSMDGDFNKILNTNIEKLRKRFPEKFTSEQAIVRNLEEERNTLETGLS